MEFGITFICPKTDEKVSTEYTDAYITCGKYAEEGQWVEISAKCPSCGEKHEFYVTSVSTNAY